jgi:hypothetical protein
VKRSAQSERLAEDARAMLSRAYISGLGLTDVLKAFREADREISEGYLTNRRKRG